MATYSTTEAAGQLLHSAEALTAPGDINALAGELNQLADTLGVVAQACERAATRVVPPAQRDNSAARRYQRAVTAWPATARPSYERMAVLLGSLHDVAGALRVAAGRCEHAKNAVDAATKPRPRTCSNR